MTLPDPAEVYRKKAEDCRREAERAVSPIDRQRWIQLAGDWMKLAQAGEMLDRGCGGQAHALSAMVRTYAALLPKHKKPDRQRRETERGEPQNGRGFPGH